MTDEILHVHHWHKQRIMCQDTKTIKEEDLPFIECCCRCNQEREIPLEITPISTDKLPPSRLVDARQKSLDRLRKQEQKEEFEGAKQTLKAYHERKARKKNV